MQMPPIYLYHGTPMENLALIAKYGLRWYGRGLFFFNSPADALDWAKMIGHTNAHQKYRVSGPSWNELISRPNDLRPVVMRVSSKNLRRELKDDGGVMYATWRVKENVAPALIEIKTDGGWMPLEGYAE